MDTKVNKNKIYSRCNNMSMIFTIFYKYKNKSCIFSYENILIIQDFVKDTY